VASLFPKRTSDPKEAFAEALDLVKAYAQQETIEPLKNLKRFLIFGLAGGMLMLLGIFFLALAGLRYMQTHRFAGQFLTADVPSDLAAYGHRLAAYASCARGQFAVHNLDIL